MVLTNAEPVKSPYGDTEFRYTIGGEVGFTRKPEYILQDWQSAVGNHCFMCSKECLSNPFNYVEGKGLYCDKCI